ncbi:MAG: hypothetical protein JXR96_22525 [Deltaproteobacteria bacterium]|nr:hypothetical protein [Deltaproteobacteria bacterium]
MHRTISIAILLAASALPARSEAQTQTDPPSDKVERRRKGVVFHAELQNLFLWRSDTDFDGSEPEYNLDGQSSGAFATVLRPTLTWHITGNLRIHYEAELGLNYWSKNNPDQQDMLQPDVFVMKHRELWGSGEFENEAGYKLGYGRFKDPTGLFINHWIGAGQVWFSWDEDTRLGLFVGQVPDATHEGISVTDNNFTRDIFVYGARWDWAIDRSWKLATAFHALYDGHLGGQERWLLIPSVHVEAGREEMKLSVDAMLQHGQAEGMTPDGHIQTLLAWAAQGHFHYSITEHLKLWPSSVDVNVLVESPDDAHPDNGMQHAFTASGKNGSATIMLSEDEIRDWYDNHDERFGSFRNGFFINRAGLFLADVKATWMVDEDSFHQHLVLGVASVLKPANAMDAAFAGFECDLISEFRIHDYAIAMLAFGVLVPGGAAAALVNTIDRDATEPIWTTEISVMLRY